jgi:hypothetical protein
MTVRPTEARVLALLRSRYESEGFSFIEHPAPSDLPSFMEGYTPDALVLGESKSIVIEIKLHREPAAEKNLRAISERFKGQARWEFRVVYGDEVEEDEAVPAPTPEQIRVQLTEAEALLAQNHPRAALVLGWATIEGVARLLNADFPSAGSRTMRQAVELLEHMGRLSFNEAQELRRLIPLRAKVVHGDFLTPITAAEVEPVLKAARVALEVH